eukprot:gene25092-10938_t
MAEDPKKRGGRSRTNKQQDRERFIAGGAENSIKPKSQGPSNHFRKEKKADFGAKYKRDKEGNIPLEEQQKGAYRFTLEEE